MTAGIRQDLCIKKGESFEHEAIVEIDQVSQVHKIVDVDDVAKRITIEGDYEAKFLTGKEVKIEQNIGAVNGNYTVASSTYVAAERQTEIVVVEAIDADVEVKGTIARRFNDPIDLTGYTIESSIGTPAGTVIVPFTVAIPDPVAGRFNLILTPAQTAALLETRAKYDVKFTSPGSVVEYWTFGDIAIEEPVTA